MVCLLYSHDLIYLLPYSGFISDVSSNSIMGEIPYGLPPNATHM